MATAPISDATTREDYTATGGQTEFTYDWWIKDEDHLDVYQNGSILTKTTDYTVSGVQDVTVCAAVSSFVQVTSPPTSIVTSYGM